MKSPFSVYLKLLSYINPHKKYLIIGGIAAILSAAVNPIQFLIIKELIDTIPKTKDFSMLISSSGWLLLLVIVGSIFTFLNHYSVIKAGQKVILDLRNKLYSHLQYLSLSFFERKRTGEIMSHITNDVGGVQAFITNGLIDFVSSTARIMGLTSYIFYVNWRLALVACIGLPLIGLSFNRFGKRLRKITADIQSGLADISSNLQEVISGIKIVKSFVRESYEIKKFSQTNYDFYKKMMKMTKISSVLYPTINLINMIGLLVVIWVGYYEMVVGRLTQGGFFTFAIAAGSLAAPINTLTRVFSMLPVTLACADRIFVILTEKKEVEEKEDAISLEDIQGEVIFENVSFSYNGGEMVLNNINIEAKPGEVIALVGPSGAGKTTIANLIPRFYDIKEGRILIDGIDIKKIKLDNLRSFMGIVPQETILFAGTIKENISYGRLDAKDEEIIQSAKDANAHSFIEEMPDGYNTIVGERGVKLSGGERQRIAIARAILKDPKILILDEATSSLDATSEALVQEALDRLMKQRTTFVIAHRLSTIRRADKILVVDDGKIKEMGTHDELYKKGGIYYTLYKKQEIKTNGKTN